MKVALVVEQMDAWRGGAETSTVEFVDALLERRVSVTLITRSRLSPRPGLEVEVVPAAPGGRARQSLAFARRADQIAGGGSFDIVHAITPCFGADVYEPRGGTIAESIERNLALRRSRTARRLKRIADRFNLKKQRLLDLEKRLLTRQPPPTVVAISRYVARQMQRHYDVPASQIEMIFNGVTQDGGDARQMQDDRASVRRQYEIGDEEIVCLMVAHNFKLKGLPEWLEAFGRLGRDRRLRTIVVGRGNPVAYLKGAEAKGLEGRVIFAGPTQRVGMFRHAADVLVHPTYFDPCSRVVLEAMSAGLPCITTRFNGAAEIITDGQSGFVIDAPDCIDDMTAAVERLLDPDVRREMGRAAQRAVAPFTMRKHADGVIDLYGRLLERKAPSPPSR